VIDEHLMLSRRPRLMAFLRGMVSRSAASRLDEVEQYATEVLRPALKKVRGLQFRVPGRDPESGKSFIVSVWVTREQAEAGV